MSFSPYAGTFESGPSAIPGYQDVDTAALEPYFAAPLASTLPDGKKYQSPTEWWSFAAFREAGTMDKDGIEDLGITAGPMAVMGEVMFDDGNDLHDVNIRFWFPNGGTLRCDSRDTDEPRYLTRLFDNMTGLDWQNLSSHEDFRKLLENEALYHFPATPPVYRHHTEIYKVFELDGKVTPNPGLVRLTKSAEISLVGLERRERKLQSYSVGLRRAAWVPDLPIVYDQMATLYPEDAELNNQSLNLQKYDTAHLRDKDCKDARRNGLSAIRALNAHATVTGRVGQCKFSPTQIEGFLSASKDGTSRYNSYLGTLGEHALTGEIITKLAHQPLTAEDLLF